MARLSKPLRSQGADLVEDGVRYRTWAPGKKKVEVVIFDPTGPAERIVSLVEEPGGYFNTVDPDGRAGDRYKYRFEGSDWPDPASRFNPDGVHGAGQVIDPSDYTWGDRAWSPPRVSELIIYELHIGTFTTEGTFHAAIGKLDHLVDLGVTAVEIMPVADFPGTRNWGYDGVLLYAPARVYGRPNDLRALVDAAHQRGLAVILDVVYNHLGPDGNYLGAYSRDYFNPGHKTPWGDGLNFELKPVRDFFVENTCYWRREFHIDGFRLDATHAIADTSKKHVLAEIAEVVHSLGGFVIAEDERNEPQLLLPPERGGMGLDAMWADDFHHVVRVMLTGTREGYYKSYEGTAEELAATLEHGWLFEGRKRAASRSWPTSSGGGPASGATHFLHYESRSNRQSRLRRAAQSSRPTDGISRSLGVALSGAFHPAYLHGSGVGRLEPIPVFYRSRTPPWPPRDRRATGRIPRLRRFSRPDGARKDS